MDGSGAPCQALWCLFYGEKGGRIFFCLSALRHTPPVPSPRARCPADSLPLPCPAAVSNIQPAMQKKRPSPCRRRSLWLPWAWTSDAGKGAAADDPALRIPHCVVGYQPKIISPRTMGPDGEIRLSPFLFVVFNIFQYSLRQPVAELFSLQQLCSTHCPVSRCIRRA